jgi:hypothetical protein
MFGFLDYETWNIYLGPRHIGQVTINSVDRAAHFTAGDDYLPAYSAFTTMRWRQWWDWCREHELPSDAVPGAF